MKHINDKILIDSIYDLIRQTSTCLPEDIESALKSAVLTEDSYSIAEDILAQILNNCRLAKEMKRPVCQDTGTPIFYVQYPIGISTREIKLCIDKALIRATQDGFLRPNAVETLSGRNSGDNTGDHFPVIHFLEWDSPLIAVKLMLKGGGSENASMQFSLPDISIQAGRDLAGVRACCLSALQRIQGQGCAPGILGVCVGGDRQTGMTLAKEQLFRSLDDINPVPELAELEAQILKESFDLQIGPMGLGGKTTLLGVKMTQAHRLPASYFVSISYMCWAARRGETLIEL